MPEASDRNPLIEVARKFSLDIGDIATLPRAEKLAIRNQIILALVGANFSTKQVATVFSMSPRNVELIVKEEYDEAIDWYKQFPAKIRIAAFKINAAAVFTELMRMKAIREQVKKDGDLKLEFLMSEKIAKLQIDYDKMLTEGATLDSIKSQADAIAELATSFDQERSKLTIKVREMEMQLSNAGNQR